MRWRVGRSPARRSIALTLRDREPSPPAGRNARFAGCADAGADSWPTEAKIMVRVVVIGRPLAVPELLTCLLFRSLRL
jgi:hypothetical protein